MSSFPRMIVTSVCSRGALFRAISFIKIRIREEYPRVEFTRKPRRRGVKLYGDGALEFWLEGHIARHSLPVAVEGQANELSLVIHYWRA